MTAQVPEKLIFNGEETSMTFCPPIPDDPLIIKELSLEEFNSDLEGFRNMPGNENHFNGDDF